MIRTRGPPDTKASKAELPLDGSGRKTGYASRSERDLGASTAGMRSPAQSGDPAVDPKVVYWTLAWIDLALAVSCACSGVIQIRRGRIEAHRRRMLLAGSLILLFLLSYPFKLGFLGRERSQLGLDADGVHELVPGAVRIAGHRQKRLSRRGQRLRRASLRRL